MENMLMCHNMRRIGAQLLQRRCKVRIQRGKCVIVKHKHTYLATICRMVGDMLLTQCSAPPHTIVPQVFAVVAHVDIDKRALADKFCYSSEELIRVVNRAVVGIIEVWVIDIDSRR